MVKEQNRPYRLAGQGRFLFTEKTRVQVPLRVKKRKYLFSTLSNNRVRTLQEFDIGSDVNACGLLNTCKLFF